MNGTTHSAYLNSLDARYPDPVRDEVHRGLFAARRYHNGKPHLPPELQRRLIDENFPHVPCGDVAQTLNESERLRLRASTIAEANERRSRAVANLREQLTEYHALLDKFSAMTERYEALEERYEILEERYKLRGRRIQMLERQVAVLKGGGRARGGPRRVSCCGVQGCGGRCGRAGAPPPPGGWSPIQEQVLRSPCPSHLPVTTASPSLLRATALPSTRHQYEDRGHLLSIDGLPSDPPRNEGRSPPLRSTRLDSPSPTSMNWLPSRDAIDVAPSRFFAGDLDPSAQIQQELAVSRPGRGHSQQCDLLRGNELHCRPCAKRPRSTL